MNKVLRISLGLNFLLLAAVALLARRPSISPNLTALGAVQPNAPATAARINVLPDKPPFSWRQIESADYRVYINNLRAIGCPESTIADIIRADVHALFAGKRAEFARTAQPVTAAWTENQEAHVLEMLLEGKSGPAVASVGPEPAAVEPLSLREMDLADLNLDSEQISAIKELRERFIEQLGGPNADPADPSYAQRWKKAQSENDLLLRGEIGVNAYMRLQNEAR